MHSRLIFRLAFLALLTALTGCGDGARSSCVVEEGRTFRGNEELRELEGCYKVEGNLSITEAPDVTDLSPLARLMWVTGHLELSQTGITDLAALRSLRRVDGVLRVESNPRLTRVDGLGALTFVGQEVILSGNDALETIEGWDACTFVPGRITLARNQSLTRVSGFERLQQVAALEVTDNPNLTDIEFVAGDLRQLSSLTIARNERLVSLRGLAMGVRVDRLILSKNPLLGQVELIPIGVNALILSELPSLRSLAWLKYLGGTTQLVLSGLGVADFGELKSLGSMSPDVEIRDNLRLTRFNTFSKVSWSPGLTKSGIIVTGNPLLVDLEGLDQLFSVKGPVVIEDNKSLQSLKGLSTLFRAEALVIRNNDSLGGLEFLSGLRYVEDVTLSGNLTSLSGLDSLLRVRDLRLEHLPRLKTLRGLDGLTLVEGSLSLSADALTSLAGLESLARYEGTLSISGCAALERLTGLEALNFPGAELQIGDNPRLPACEAENLLRRLRSKGLRGSGDLHDNLGTGTCP